MQLCNATLLVLLCGVMAGNLVLLHAQPLSLHLRWAMLRGHENVDASSSSSKSAGFGLVAFKVDLSSHFCEMVMTVERLSSPITSAILAVEELDFAMELSVLRGVKESHMGVGFRFSDHELQAVLHPAARIVVFTEAQPEGEVFGSLQQDDRVMIAPLRSRTKVSKETNYVEGLMLLKLDEQTEELLVVASLRSNPEQRALLSLGLNVEAAGQKAMFAELHDQAQLQALSLGQPVSFPFSSLNARLLPFATISLQAKESSAVGDSLWISTISSNFGQARTSDCDPFAKHQSIHVLH